MSLTTPGHGALTGLGVAIFAGVGLVGSVVAGLGVVAAPRPTPPAPASVREAPCVGEALPTLAGGEGIVVGAAGRGLLAGMASDAAGVSWPVLWRHGRLVRLSTGLDPVTTADVNREGLVVGSGYDVRTDTSVAWAWLAGTTHVLPMPAGSSAVAEDVDDSGRIVGSIEIGEDEQAAVWGAFDQRPRLLRPLPGDQGSHAFSIAPDGTVGGVSLGDGGTPVVWRSGGMATALGSTSTQGAVLGFDDESRPAGTSYLADGRARATVWSDPESTTRLAAPRAPGEDAVVGGAGRLLVGTTGGQGAGTRPLGTVWENGSRAGVLAPVDGPGFRGLASSAAAVTGSAEKPVVVGYSADDVGRRVPTLWRCR